ncbi:maleylpyruvate isomerase N-terminal domain-containing protein [Catellatospora tritici]|uniref:maleylpyruvate isomerase N-terminal domain-containing protein n=1 Tax=Catellatospora tritici TaxID=2851566 RepID=UPI001C2D9C92|nr:maleylpyruvate isomerase N-terminal domain-containing protein [Catellatospora tritici]MBV1853089.1 maleylpyruvate isomerase N-terminal domain-containing protein [Catellatospora tritici]
MPTVPVDPAQWDLARRALTEAVERVITLAEAHPPQTMVTADWTIADTMAHLVSLMRLDDALVQGRSPDELMPGALALVDATNVDTVVEVNRAVLAHFTGRDVATSSRQLRESAASLLAAVERADPAAQVSWLGASRLSIAGLLAHMVNELVIHGWDIARATRTPWPMDPYAAGLFFDLFILGVTKAGYGALLEHGAPIRPGRIAVDFRSDYTTPAMLVLTDGCVTAEDPDPRADVRLTFDPPTLNLMLFGRVSKPRAALTGKVRLGGRRPWLLPAFMRTMHLPS